MKLGLGCSRLGSIGGLAFDDAVNLLRCAYDFGVRYYDTSCVYGQGDSERALGSAVSGHDNVVLCTKVGKVLPSEANRLMFVKGALRTIARFSPHARNILLRRRSAPLPTNWSPSSLLSSVDGSLRRLGVSFCHEVLLHSPPSPEIVGGVAIQALREAKSAGTIGLVGISVDTLEEALLALECKPVEVLQLPFTVWSCSELKSALKGRSVKVVVRELYSSMDSTELIKPSFREQRLRTCLEAASVARVLVGTTSLKHLEEAASFARLSS